MLILISSKKKCHIKIYKVNEEASGPLADVSVAASGNAEDIVVESPSAGQWGGMESLGLPGLELL